MRVSRDNTARGINTLLLTQQHYFSMFAAGSKSQRIAIKPTPFIRIPRLPQRNTTLTPPPPLRLHKIHTTPHPCPRTRPAEKPTRAALEPLAFTLAFVVSVGITYTVDRYTAHPAHPDIEDPESQATKHNPEEEVQQYSLVMAPSTPPGRPGNLTAEQEPVSYTHLTLPTKRIV